MMLLTEVMRGNLVFHNVPEEKDENPEATKALLANILANHFNKDQNDVMYDIVRALRRLPNLIEINVDLYL